MTMFLAFGLTFEVPVAVILLVKAGAVSIEKLKEARPYVIVGAFVIAAIITPPDVISQFMLAVPMCVLYEVGILIARFISKTPAKPDAKDHDSDLDDVERIAAPDSERS